MEPCLKKKRAMSALNTGSCRSIDQQHLEEEEEDRLSSLPDSLIVSILSLLPIKSAAATSVLSRRWVHLWTQLTHILLRLRPFVSPNVISHILSQLKSTKIHTFDAHLIFHPFDVRRLYGFLVSWIHDICRRNPEVFIFNFDSVITFRIPFCLFETQSLVQLELHSNFEHALIPYTITSMKLPNLKKLALTLSLLNDDPMFGRNGPLFTACPLLEDLNLNLRLREDDHVVHISTPKLKCLRLIVIPCSSEECTFVIDAPNLERFHLDGFLMFYHFVTNPINLQQVELSIDKVCFGADIDYMSKIPGLIQGVSCATSLVLQDCAIHLLRSINHLHAVPIFRNLIYLSLSYCNYFGAWINKLPGCFLLANLKRLDLHGLACDDVEVNSIQHILHDAIVLEKLLVTVDGYCDESRLNKKQVRKEYEFCNKLFMLSKSSDSCDIEFSGTAITASSIDFRDGVLTYPTPLCLLESQSRVELHLPGFLEFNLLQDKTRSFTFPKLKKLALDSDPYISMIGRNGTLFKSCPLLEDLDLTLHFTMDDRVVDISATNLKSLRMRVKTDLLEDCKVLIDAPNLEEFNLSGDLTVYDFVKNPSNLQKVEISNADILIRDDTDYTSKILGLIPGICCVRSLVLEKHASVYFLLSISDYYLYSISDLNASQIFRNLIYFSLACSYNFGIHKLPRCLFSDNLKRIDLRELLCNNDEIKLIKHILSNATALEKLQVFADYEHCFDKGLSEFQFCEKLFMLSKSSVNCQIKFSGLTIMASSDNFRDGVLSLPFKDELWDGSDDTD